MIERRAVIVGLAAAPLVASAADAATAVGAFTPEAFGAYGDGRSDDSAAFARMSDAVNAAGGGTIRLRRTTYLVGSDGTIPAQIIDLSNCARAIRIDGNGAKLRCRAGARYGADVPVAVARAEKRSVVKFRPYVAMIQIAQCTGSIDIADVELDGNSDAHVVGQPFGDIGWQIPCAGLFLRNNAGAERVSRVYAHHQAWDGIYLDGIDQDARGVERLIREVKCDSNGRQGMSVVGGRNYNFERCSFTRTGRGKIRSAPAAGVDIEAERGKVIRGLRFVDCSFVDNAGIGLVADTGDSADLRFERCTFVGATNYSAWPKKPRMVFSGCTFVGTLVNCYGDTDPAVAGRFVNCVFSDDPARSPTGKVFLRGGYIANLPHGGGGLTFERCRFTLQHDGVLPWSAGVRWIDCTMSQRAPALANTRGTFLGTTRIEGNVSIHKSQVVGTLILNGKTVPRTPPVVGEPAGAKGG